MERIPKSPSLNDSGDFFFFYNSEGPMSLRQWVSNAQRPQIFQPPTGVGLCSSVSAEVCSPQPARRDAQLGRWLVILSFHFRGKGAHAPKGLLSDSHSFIIHQAEEI